MMDGDPKPSRKYEHLYAILRYEADADPSLPIELRVTVKEVVDNPRHAEEEVRRLNDLNRWKGAYYFSQIARFDAVAAVAAARPIEPPGLHKDNLSGRSPRDKIA